jgi:hypothetical protein
MTAESARNVVLGTINGGLTNVTADVTILGAATNVLLSTNYTLASPRPPGYPFRPGLTGTASPESAGEVFLSGATISVLLCEANALVAAGAGSITP